MSNTSGDVASLIEAFTQWKEGEISEEKAKEVFGDEWEQVKQLARVEEILEAQTEFDSLELDLYS